MWGLAGQAKLIEPVMTRAMASMLCEGARMAGDVWDGLGGTRMNLVGGGVFLVLGAVGVVWPGVGVVAGGGEAEKAGGFGRSLLCHFHRLEIHEASGGGGRCFICP